MQMKRFLGVILLLLAGLTLGAAAVDWSKAKTVQKGVLLYKIALKKPRLMKVNLMRIDLTTPGLQFTGTGRDPDWGKPMPDYPKAKIHTKRVRTADFMREARAPQKKGGAELNMIVAANSAPWRPWTSPWNHVYAHPAGLGILNGEVICDTRPHRAVFAVYQDGRVVIVPEIPESDYPNIRVAASGFAIILQDGKITQGGGYEKEPMPRIAYGLSADKKYLYIVTIDGRQKEWSMGATGTETAQFLVDAGAADGINMDGGGSATLVYWQKSKHRAVVVNQQPNKEERKVGSNIGIYLEAPNKE